jgi:uncharacterized membrane protein YgcG
MSNGNATMMLLRCAVITLAPLALSACIVPDASRAESPWSPQGVNAANLAAMVKDPADLSHGHGDKGPDRKLSAQAVTTLWENPSPSLPQSGASSGSGSGASGSGSGSSGSGGSGGGSGTTGSGS